MKDDDPFNYPARDSCKTVAKDPTLDTKRDGLDLRNRGISASTGTHCPTLGEA